MADSGVAACKGDRQQGDWTEAILLLLWILLAIRPWVCPKWNLKQKSLIDSGVSTADVAPLQRARKLTQLIDKLKQHRGPLNSEDEIDGFVRKYGSLDYKKFAIMLNDEIRFHRDSNLRFSLSQDCYSRCHLKMQNCRIS
jgi:hypothetical protein